MSHRFLTAFTNDQRFGVTVRQRPEAPETSTPSVFGAALPERFAVFTPEGYEPNYAYPLVVWFHSAGEDERVLHRLLPQVSERNVVGLALRGEVKCGTGFDWTTPAPASRENRFVSTVRKIRREHHVHSERIILAGQGSGATAAAELFFARPEWFGGLALFDTPATGVANRLTADENLAGKPVLIDLPLELLGRGRDAASRFTASGLDVSLRHSRLGAMDVGSLRHLNRWLMGSICGAVV